MTRTRERIKWCGKCFCDRINSNWRNTFNQENKRVLRRRPHAGIDRVDAVGIKNSFLTRVAFELFVALQRNQR